MGELIRFDVEAGTPAWMPGLWLEIPDPLRPPPGMLLVGAVLVTLALTLPQLRRRRLVALGLATTVTLSLGSSCDPATMFSWVHTDPLGTPLAVTDSPTLPTQPRAIWRASYEPFGKATVNEDPDGDTSPFRLSVRFPGQYADLESGLHYNFFRTYDPATGRYLEADPIGQASGLHIFAYVGSNPLAFVDPEGLGPRGAVIGSAIGSVVGGVLGGLSGAAVGAAVGTPALPGGGTVAGGVIGGNAGAAEGILLGGVGGAAAGSLLEDYVVLPVLEMAKGGRQNLENEWSREARLQPDPCKWLRDQYDKARDSVTRSKIKQAQKVLGCRRSSAMNDRCQ